MFFIVKKYIFLLNVLYNSTIHHNMKNKVCTRIFMPPPEAPKSYILLEFKSSTSFMQRISIVIHFWFNQAFNIGSTTPDRPSETTNSVKMTYHTFCKLQAWYQKNYKNSDPQNNKFKPHLKMNKCQCIRFKILKSSGICKQMKSVLLKFTKGILAEKPQMWSITLTINLFHYMRLKYS